MDVYTICIKYMFIFYSIYKCYAPKYSANADYNYIFKKNVYAPTVRLLANIIIIIFILFKIILNYLAVSLINFTSIY